MREHGVPCAIFAKKMALGHFMLEFQHHYWASFRPWQSVSLYMTVSQ
ncbi:unnamed protein product [Linum tenue]|uniref:Uncharacterized protein n=1 Tax=Linum tenue TaxID=586396 RepID=A0AAV0N2X7_9ROSI|nr:unnamed protein product [Linum tenue]